MFQRIAILLTFLVTTTSYADNHEQALTGLQNATETLISAVSENREELHNNHSLLYKTVGDIVMPYFDFERMSRLAMGKLWRRATKEEKAQFEEEFTTLIIRTYATAIFDYTNQNIKWKLGGQGKRGKVNVTSTITNTSGISTTIKFKMAKSKNYDGYRVYDVVVEGISIILGYRNVLSEKARSVGISGIIPELRTKNNYQK